MTCNVALAVPRMHLLNRAITTDCVAAAELYWLVQKFSADFAREMLKAQWRWKWCKFSK